MQPKTPQLIPQNSDIPKPIAFFPTIKYYGQLRLGGAQTPRDPLSNRGFNYHTIGSLSRGKIPCTHHRTIKSVQFTVAK